jgi:hypothetical protein
MWRLFKASLRLANPDQRWAAEPRLAHRHHQCRCARLCYRQAQPRCHHRAPQDRPSPRCVFNPNPIPARQPDASDVGNLGTLNRIFPKAGPKYQLSSLELLCEPFRYGWVSAVQHDAAEGRSMFFNPWHATMLAFESLEVVNTRLKMLALGGSGAMSEARPGFAPCIANHSRRRRAARC